MSIDLTDYDPIGVTAYWDGQRLIVSTDLARNAKKVCIEGCPQGEQWFEPNASVSALLASHAKAMTRIEKLEAALREIVWRGEQHTESAVGRRMADFRAAVKVAAEALSEGGTHEGS